MKRTLEKILGKTTAIHVSLSLQGCNHESISLQLGENFLHNSASRKNSALDIRIKTL